MKNEEKGQKEGMNVRRQRVESNEEKEYRITEQSIRWESRSRYRACYSYQVYL
jgi:hypothetical protein